MAPATNSFELMCCRIGGGPPLGRNSLRDEGAPSPSAGQSRSGSFIESVANVAIGIGIAFLGQEIIFPFYGIHVSTRSNLEIVAWFTAISLARSFLLRRLFNRITTNG